MWIIRKVIQNIFTWTLLGNHADSARRHQQFGPRVQISGRQIDTIRYILWKPHPWEFESHHEENSEIMEILELIKDLIDYLTWITFKITETMAHLNFGFHFLMSFFGDFQMSLLHIVGLFGIKIVRDTSKHENIQLNSALTFFFLSFMFLL